ncbi:NmrA family NAD(P)-binding protein [Desertivirga arenae]|uniref:NmrA family NAD(P)-binding protein n=1 Tax=Desertivirga arenae TaxID=2810309 RepID=UPI001A973A15|nr:NAD(P)H-binding protein [Pedobacter sp. SYSU D00823]
MNITITGSIGHISRPLAKGLIEKGHVVTVISSNSDRKKEIEELGANAAIGSLEDKGFLAASFAGSDAVYTMVPPNNYFDPSLNLIDYYQRLGDNYTDAIQKSGVKRVVNLSSIGAHLKEGNGILVGAYNVEQTLNQLSREVSITHIRPTSFYYNLYGYVEMIKNAGVIAANYGGEGVIPWVAPVDIADAVGEELVDLSTKRNVRYVCSEELSGNETARILGERIGKPELKWLVISDEETLAGLEQIGMNQEVAAGLVEMYQGLRTGLLAEDYYRNRPAKLGNVKMLDFATEFATQFPAK